MNDIFFFHIGRIKDLCIYEIKSIFPDIEIIKMIDDEFLIFKYDNINDIFIKTLNRSSGIIRFGIVAYHDIDDFTDNINIPSDKKISIKFSATKPIQRKYNLKTKIMDIKKQYPKIRYIINMELTDTVLIQDQIIKKMA